MYSSSLSWALLAAHNRIFPSAAPRSEYQGQKLNSIYDIHENTIKGTQYVDKDTYRLHITGLVETPKNFTYEDIITNFTQYKKVATLNCVEGWSVVLLWEGPLMRDCSMNPIRNRGRPPLSLAQATGSPPRCSLST